jgi:hypothetical protein
MPIRPRHFPHASTLLLAALGFTLALAVARTAGAYHTRFVANYCNYNAPTPTAYFTRQGSIDVAYTGNDEGYQWGGGCWNDNNRDDSAGDPPQDPATGGEGGDCSGFTFKVWRESENTSDARAYQWGKFRFVHGPYVAADFRYGNGAPNVSYAKSGLIRMDALASDFHIGMIYATNVDGTDQIVEAKGEAYGTDIRTRSYRTNVGYGGVRRLGWSA